MTPQSQRLLAGLQAAASGNYDAATIEGLRKLLDDEKLTANMAVSLADLLSYVRWARGKLDRELLQWTGDPAAQKVYQTIQRRAELEQIGYSVKTGNYSGATLQRQRDLLTAEATEAATAALETSGIALRLATKVRQKSDVQRWTEQQLALKDSTNWWNAVIKAQRQQAQRQPRRR